MRRPPGEAARLARLRLRAARHYTLRDLTLAFDGLPTLHITQPADPDAPLDLLAAQQHTSTPPSQASGAAAEARAAVAAGERLPYWALLWPSGLALAEEVLLHGAALAGTRTLELGCGLGVAATAALLRGAHLWAADCFAEALLFCRYNALRTAGRTPHPLLLDWRTASGQAACLAAGPFANVLAADVLYEQEDIAQLLALVPRLLMPGGTFWLAEPERRVSLAFVAAARATGWAEHLTTYDRHWHAAGETTRVRVHRFTLT